MKNHKKTTMKNIFKTKLRSFYRHFLRNFGYSKNLSRLFFKILKLASYIFIPLMIFNVVSLLSVGNHTLGTFGDFIGGTLNPILTFFMLMGLITTIILQKKELTLARREFQRSADALSEQSKSLELQRFESSFLNLINQLKKFEDDIEENKSPDHKNFEKIYYLLTTSISHGGCFSGLNVVEIEILYRNRVKDEYSNLHPYFINIYCLIDLLFAHKSHPFFKTYSMLLVSSVNIFGVYVLLVEAKFNGHGKQYFEKIKELGFIDRACIDIPSDVEPLLSKLGYLSDPDTPPLNLWDD